MASIARQVLRDLQQQLLHLYLCSCWCICSTTCYHSYSISMSVAVGVPDLQTIGTSYGYTATGSGTMDLYLLSVLLYLMTIGTRTPNVVVRLWYQWSYLYAYELHYWLTGYHVVSLCLQIAIVVKCCTCTTSHTTRYMDTCSGGMTY